MIATEGPPVIVIGAGVSGLVAVKSCLEEDFPVICYEATNSIGGLWKFREEGMSCMKSTFLNISKEWTAFSDFPAPPEFPNYFSNTCYLTYLTNYAEKYDLLPHIRVEHRVLWISKMPNYEETGQWSVQITNKQGKSEDHVASAVIVCTGAFATPSIPKIQGIENFKGKVMHSKEYKIPQGMDNKNVVVVGSGNTAGDIAVELGRVASKTYLALRRGTIHVGRIGHNGIPVDIAGFSRFGFWISTYWQSDEKAAKLISGLSSLQVDKDLYNLQLDSSKLSSSALLVNDELPLSIIKGSVQIKNQVHEFTPDGVVFEGEETKVYPVDTVILATGYQNSMKTMLDDTSVSQEVLNRGLYRRVFPVNLPHSTIAFIGCCLNFGGASSHAAELQARWAARIFSKKQKLPAIETMQKDLKNYEKLLTEQNREQSLAVVQYYPYIDDLAKEIGAKPNLLRMLSKDPTLFWACVTGPMVAYHYRLNGPHPWPQARKTILTVHDRIRAGFETRPNPKKQHGNHMLRLKWYFLFPFAALVITYAWKHLA